MTSIITGRFAPSPTGPLHYGSLLAALASFLSVRSQDGCWLVRMEDIDPPREMAGAADDILRTLEKFHLHWDGQIMYQSARIEAYEAVLQAVIERGLAYTCTCTRKEIRERGETAYQGHCRDGSDPDRSQHSIRIRSTADDIGFTDLIQGKLQYNLRAHAGDFNIRRADGLFAYQLAVVVDDAAQQVTEIIRGADLLESTTHQLYLQGVMGYSTPLYGHIPVAVIEDGVKLSKQTGAQPVSSLPVVPVLIRALQDLGQSPPDALRTANAEEVIEWAVGNWSLDQVPVKTSVKVAV